ncbi:MAG: hypothetical protein ACOCZ8_06420 [Bacteroidota bacterium]
MIREILQFFCPPTPDDYSPRITGLWLCLLCAVFALPSIAQTQGDDLRVLSTLKLDRKEPKPLWFEFVPSDGGLVTISYMSRRSSREIGLYKYNANFERTWREMIFENSRNTKIEYLAVVQGLIYVFTSRRDAKDDVNELWVYSYELNGRQAAKPQVVHRQPTSRSDYEVRFSKSLNKRQLLVYIDRNTRAENELIDYFIFGGAAFPSEEGTLKVPYPDDDFEIREIAISGEKDLYLLGRYNKGGRVRAPQDLSYTVFYKPLSSKRLFEYKIADDERFLTTLKLKISREGQAMLGGFFSYRSPSQIVGTVYARIPVDTLDAIRSAELTFHELDNAFLQRYLRPRQLNKGQELEDFYLDKLILRSDGGMLMLAEEYYVQQSTFRNMNGMWITQRIYHYNDIMVVSLAPGGGIEWVTAVPKMQSDDDPQELSYAAFAGAQGLFLFYKSRERGTGANVFVRQVDINGDLSLPRPFFERYRTNDVFYRGACEQISNASGVVVFYQSRGKLFTMLKIGF